MKRFLVLLLAAAMVFSLAACQGNTQNNTANTGNTANQGNTVAPSSDVKAMSYKEYLAAGEAAAVVIEGYVQAYAYNKTYGNVSMFIQDDDGAYYAYRAVCSEEQAAKLAEGVKVKVSGNKTTWSGEVEVGEGCTFEIGEGTKIYPAADVSSKLSDAKALEEKMNQRVASKGLVVQATTDANGNPVSFLYNWDGSGQKGANNDVYFNVSYEGKNFTFCVESDEVAEGTAAYDAVTALNIGDVIDIEGMMYWYNGPNMHVNKLSVAKASVADTKKGENTMTYEQYVAAKDDDTVIIEGYVQGLTAYNTQYYNFNVFLSDADGSYYAYRVNATQDEYNKLSKGCKIKVLGYKASYHGMPEVAEGCTFELLDGYYIAPAKNATASLEDQDALAKMIASPVTLKDLKVVASKAPDDDKEYAFLYNWNGSGSAGANSDVYFKVAAANGKQYSVCVESDEQPEGSATYSAATGLNIGDSVDLECFIYWYDTAEFHVQSISVKR